MTPTRTFSHGCVRLSWHPHGRLAVLRFAGPRAHPTEEEALACMPVLREWVGTEAARFLVDCEHVRNADAGWRAAFSRFLAERGYRDRVAWCDLDPFIGMMAAMFARATGIDGRSFRAEEDALAWLRTHPVTKSGGSA